MKFFGSLIPGNFAKFNIFPKFTAQPGENLFGNTSILPEPPKNDTFQKTSVHRLNDFDSNILGTSVHKLSDDNLKAELQLEKSEDELKKIDDKITLIKMLEISAEKSNLEELELKKQKLTEEIEDKKAVYRNLGTLNRLADFISNVYTSANQQIIGVMSLFNAHPTVIRIKNLIPPLKRRNELRENLEKITLLQENLSAMLKDKNNPFGESETKLKEYVSFMGEANRLESKIKKIAAPEKSDKAEKAEKARFSDLWQRVVEFVVRR